jgi:rhodanese-related sulfurtransferase
VPRLHLLALSLLFAGACAGSTSPVDGGAVLGSISVQSLHQILLDGHKDFLLINVHTPVAGNIPQTDKDIPYTDVDALALFVGSDLDQKVVLYCMSNAMSTSAGNALMAKGYRAVRIVDGGLTAWKAAGYQVDGEAGPDASAPLSDAGVAQSISVGDLHEAVTQGPKDFLLINVHTPYAGDIPGTDKDIPFTDVDAIAAFVGKDLDQKVVVYCMTSGMSTTARSGLLAKGYRAVLYLDGGMNMWMMAGYSLIFPPDAGRDAGPGGDSATAVDAMSQIDAGPTLDSLSVTALHDALASDGGKDFLLINVHTPLAGDIPGTDKDIAYTDPDAIAAFIGPDLDTRVVVYCMSNYMSTIAATDLVAKGYRAVRYLDGGLSAWEAAGYPVQ